MSHRSIYLRLTAGNATLSAVLIPWHYATAALYNSQCRWLELLHGPPTSNAMWEARALDLRLCFMAAYRASRDLDAELARHEQRREIELGTGEEGRLVGI